MYNTPWSDGVPGVTQRQIPSGDSFVYKWTATQYGSYWYHAHQRGLLGDGQFGPIVIHPQRGVKGPWKKISARRGRPLCHQESRGTRTTSYAVRVATCVLARCLGPDDQKWH